MSGLNFSTLGRRERRPARTRRRRSRRPRPRCTSRRVDAFRGRGRTARQPAAWKKSCRCWTPRRRSARSRISMSGAAPSLSIQALKSGRIRRAQRLVGAPRGQILKSHACVGWRCPVVLADRRSGRRWCRRPCTFICPRMPAPENSGSREQRVAVHPRSPAPSSGPSSVGRCRTERFSSRCVQW